jgi:hypothetical protein
MNLLETRENIKIESHPFFHIICDLIFMGIKKSRMAHSKKQSFSKSPISTFGSKISELSGKKLKKIKIPNKLKLQAIILTSNSY